MGIYEGFKDVVSLVQKADNIDLLQKVLGLQADVYNLMEENRELKERLRKRDDIKLLSNQLTYKENAYWKDEDGPYCSNCWDANQLLVRLNSTDGCIGTCPNCKNNVIYNIKLYNQYDGE